MNTSFLRKGRAWLFSVLFLFVGVGSAGAEIQLMGEKLTMTGYLRHQLVANIGYSNPFNTEDNYDVQDEHNWLNLSRTWLVTELTYKPNDTFKFFVKPRVIWDQTTNLDGALYEYDAITLPTSNYGTYMRAGHNDKHVAAEIWELYGDMDVGNFWIRVGRQQIVWGEMISARIMDIVNPLDVSWHFKWEPEEFENIRIPLWMIRSVYNIEQSLMDELYVEGFFNPGDIVPTNNPVVGNAYRLNYVPPIYTTVDEQDRRGDHEFGGRIGYKIGMVAGTLNYAYLYTDDPYSNSGAWIGPEQPPTPPPVTGRPPWYEVEDFYPHINVYGMTMNYALDRPFNTVVTFEGRYTPDMPYYDRDSPYTPGAGVLQYGFRIKEVDEYAFAINLQRFSNIIPNQPFMNVIFQYQTLYIPDHDEVKLTPGADDKNNIVEKFANDAFVLSLSQDFSYKTYKATCVMIWQPDGSWRVNPGFKYSPGDNWRYEIFANWWGGSAFEGKNKHQLNYFENQDEVMARITYQF